MGREMGLEGLVTDKNLEILILTILSHQIFLRFRIELWPLAFSNLERGTVYGKKNNHRVSLWDSAIGNKQSLPTRSVVKGVVTNSCMFFEG